MRSGTVSACCFLLVAFELSHFCRLFIRNTDLLDEMQSASYEQEMQPGGFCKLRCFRHGCPRREQLVQTASQGAVPQRWNWRDSGLQQKWLAMMSPCRRISGFLACQLPLAVSHPTVEGFGALESVHGAGGREGGAPGSPSRA